MSKQSISNWEELEWLFDDIKRLNGPYQVPRRIFRGLSTTAYQLIPRIGRPGCRKSLSDGSILPPHDSEQEKASLARLKAVATCRLTGVPATTDLEWLAVAQHHNMPTRLMDWTTDPFIAAWFAVTKAGTETSGPPVIYSLRTPPKAPSGCDPFSVKELLAFFPAPGLHPRIEKQCSVLTIHPAPASVEALDVVVYTLPFGRERGETFRIKRKLYEKGIHDGALIPDLEGITSHIGWEYKWGIPIT